MPLWLGDWDLSKVQSFPVTKGIRRVKLSHSVRATRVAFDDPNLVSPAGLVPVLALAERAGLRDLADVHLSVPTDKGANAGLKVASLVAGMVAGADSIDDMALLRHGGMGRLFTSAYAPSTLGSFLREFRFGHVRQLDAVASRFLAGLASRAPLFPAPAGTVAGWAMLDVDDTVIEVHGYAKQGAGFGYNKLRGLNALIATLGTSGSAPLIVAQRLRKGSTSSPRGAKRLVADAARTASRLLPAGVPMLLRADSAFYGRPTIAAALTGGAAVSVTVRLDPRVKAAIGSIPADAWTRIEYPHPTWDEASQQWVSRAEVAETRFTAFTSKPKAEQVTGRLVIRRIPELNPDKTKAGQDALFDAWRFHAFFTTTAPAVFDTITADKIHRGHAVIEQVHADLKNSALAHLPSGVFTANAAWLVCAVIAFNLTRAAGTLAGGDHAKATGSTVRRTLINVPARIAHSARRLVMHLPTAWPWQAGWNQLLIQATGPPASIPA